MKKILLLIVFVIGLCVVAPAQSNPPLRIREVDGSPSKVNATQLRFPNGTLTISGGIVTYTPVGGVGAGTVTNTAGALTSGKAIIGNGSDDLKASKVTITDPATTATLTLSNNSSLITSGGHSITLTSTGATNITLPTTGTLSTLAGSESLSNKTLASPTITGAITFPDNVRQTFNPGANASGINVGSQTADPDTPTNGDLYYDSDDHLLRARINSAWVSLGAGGAGSPGGSDTQIQFNNAGSFGGSANLTFSSNVLTIASGATITSPGAGTASEKFGASIVMNSANNAVGVGNGVTLNGLGGHGQTVVGQGATGSATDCVVMGRGGDCTNTFGVAIGAETVVGNEGTAVGRQNQATALGSASVGYQSRSNGAQTNLTFGDNNWAIGTSSNTIQIGSGTTINNLDNVAILGFGSDTTHSGNSPTDLAAGDFLLGLAGNSFVNFYFGGKSSATPAAVTLAAIKSSGSNVAGVNLNLQGGQSTGTALGGSITLATSPAGSSGTSLNAFKTVHLQVIDDNILSLQNGSNGNFFQIHQTFTSPTDRVYAQFNLFGGELFLQNINRSGGGTSGGNIVIRTNAFDASTTDWIYDFTGAAGNDTRLIPSGNKLQDLGGSSNFIKDGYFVQLFADATITAGGTTGNQTINKSAGTVNVAASGTAITVTNSLVSASSLVFAIARTNDSTCAVKNAVPGSGTVTINMTAACTAETSVAFWVLNR